MSRRNLTPTRPPLNLRGMCAALFTLLGPVAALQAQTIVPEVKPVSSAVVDKLTTLDPKAYLEGSKKINQAVIDQTQQKLAELNQTGISQNPLHPYLWAKAQRWLDVAQDELRNNNRGPFPQAALDQSHQLIAAIVSNTQEAYLTALNTPLLDGAIPIRPDLSAPLGLWKTLAPEGQGAPVAQAGARCALASAAYTEVQLVWAGWISKHYGWRSALPYIAHAENAYKQAEAQFIACRDQAAAQELKAPTAIAVSEAPAVASVLVPAGTSGGGAPAMAARGGNAALPSAKPVDEALETLYFEHQSADLTVAAQMLVKKIADRWLAALNKPAIELQASVDDSGRGQNNTELIRNRALAVATRLVELKVPADKLVLINAVALKPTVGANQDPSKRVVMVRFLN